MFFINSSPLKYEYKHIPLREEYEKYMNKHHNQQFNKPEASYNIETDLIPDEYSAEICSVLSASALANLFNEENESIKHYRNMLLYYILFEEKSKGKVLLPHPITFNSNFDKEKFKVMFATKESSEYCKVLKKVNADIEKLSLIFDKDEDKAKKEAEEKRSELEEMLYDVHIRYLHKPEEYDGLLREYHDMMLNTRSFW